MANEQGFIEIREPWTIQPPAFTLVDRSNPLTRNIEIACLCRHPFNSAYPGEIGSFNNGDNKNAVASVKGEATDFNLTGLTGNDCAIKFPVGVAPGTRYGETFTHAILVKPELNHGTTEVNALTTLGGDSFSPAMIWDHTNGTFDGVATCRHSGTFFVANLGGSSDAGSWHMYMATVDSISVSERLIAYRDGIETHNVPMTSGTTVDWETSDNDLGIMGYVTGAESSVPGVAALFCIWGHRVFTPQEAKSFADNPWQIFQPRTTIIPVGIEAAAEGRRVIVVT